MRAVNLIPPDASGSGAPAATDVQATVYAVLGGLAIAVVLMILFVTTGNKISERKVQLATLQQEVQQTQAALGQLTSYVQFQQLAQTREQTVKQLADGRYDWASTFSQLSRVIPRNTTLSNVTATLSPTVTGGASSGLRSAIQAPAIEMTGCTASQVDVARLMSRLRLTPGVTRVTLASSQGAAPTTSSTTSSTTAATTSSSTASTGCGRGPNFDLIVFLTPPAPSGTATTPSGTP